MIDDCGEGSAARDVCAKTCILLESDCPYLGKALADFMPAAQKFASIKQV